MIRPAAIKCPSCDASKWESCISNGYYTPGQYHVTRIRKAKELRAKRLLAKQNQINLVKEQ